MSKKWSSYEKQHIITENWRKHIAEEPLAVAVLGAPAAGKTYTRNLIGKI